MYPTIETSVKEILSATWNITDGTVVPETKDIVMKNGGRRIDATYLYADMADSSTIAQTIVPEAAAKIIRSFVSTSTRILRKYDGHIRSFDGDRVMAIFIGDDKNTRAVRAAFAINWAVREVIRPAVKANWDWSNIKKDLYNISHRVGIDTGESLIVRGGARDNNDLISVGGAPNIAAKLSDQKTGFATYITEPVFSELNDELLYYEEHGSTHRCWTRLNRSVEVGGHHHIVYGSNVQWGI